MRLIIYEDGGVAGLGPLAQTRPVFELRCGAVSLLERQWRCLGADGVEVVVRPELAGLCRLARPRRRVNEPAAQEDESVVLVNGRWLAPGHCPPGLDEPHAGLVGDQLAYLVTPPGAAAGLTAQNLAWHIAAWRQALPSRRVDGVMIERPWDLVENNACALHEDARHWQTHRPTVVPPNAVILGPPQRVLADPTARVEPLAVIDTTNGPVLLDEGVVVRAFSQLRGPCYVGPGTHVLGGRVEASSLGPLCRIGGEVDASIVHGRSNKAHDGFLGHSYVGEWVNLGAGTHTSNLRNDYGPVTVTIAGQRVETGLMKVGSFIGDHTKTSIGTLFNTGSVCGPFAMLITAGSLLPRSLPAFCQVSQGRMTGRTDTAEMFATAQTMMTRRGVRWDAEHAEFYLDLYERTEPERQRLLRDTERRLRRVV